MAIEKRFARCVISAALLFLVPALFLQAQALETGFDRRLARAGDGNAARSVVKPELNSFSPSVFVVGENAVYELTIFTKNLDPDAEIYLRHLDGTLITPVNSIHEADNYARLSFDNNQLIPGDYEIVIRNYGHMEASKEGFTIAPSVQEKMLDAAKEKPVKVYLGGTYALGETLFHSVFFGASLKLNQFNLGLEMAHTDREPFINLDFRLIMKYIFREWVAFCPLFWGGGFDKQGNLLEGHINASFSALQFWITKHIFLELPSFDYTYSITKNFHFFSYRFLTMGLRS